MIAAPRGFECEDTSCCDGGQQAQQQPSFSCAFHLPQGDDMGGPPIVRNLMYDDDEDEVLKLPPTVSQCGPKTRSRSRSVDTATPPPPPSMFNNACVPDDDDPEPGIGRFYTCFTDITEIGHGDFGSVYAATCSDDGQRYAVKVCKKAAQGSVDLQHRLQEVYAISCCCSPFIVRYYDAWVEKELVYLQTELLMGSIAKTARPWPEEDVWNLLLQGGLGLHSIHCASVAHLDIKPDNIFCDADDDAPRKMVFKIGDFGLARPVDRPTTSYMDDFAGLNDDEGDCRYVCPVLLRTGRGTHLREADIYSFGATVVDLCGGDPQLARNEETQALDCLDAYTTALQHVIRGMIHEDPLQRPTAFQIVEAASDYVLCDWRSEDEGGQFASLKNRICELEQDLRCHSQDNTA